MMNIYILCFLLLFVNTSAFAAKNELTPQSKLLLQSLKYDVQEALIRLAEIEKKQGRNIRDFSYSITLPEEQNVNLGLIFEMTESKSAFEVLAVTSGSLASQYGLKAGDKILAINSIQVNADNEPTIMANLTNLNAGNELVIQLIRHNITQELSFTIQAQFMPKIELHIDSNLKAVN